MRTIVLGLVAVVSCYRDPAPATTVAGKQTVHSGKDIANSDPLAYLPENSEAVIVIDAKAVRSSPVWKSIELMLRPRIEALMSAFVQTCNFDPIAQLRGISLGLRGVGNGPKGVFVVRGYQRAQVMACIEGARARDASEIKIEGGVVTVPNQAAFTFVDDTTLVALLEPTADAQALRAVIDGGAPLRLATGFLELASRVERSHAWLVITKESNALSSLTSLGARPVGTMLALDFREDLRGQLRIRFEQPDQATQAVAVFQPQMAQIQALFPGITVDADDLDAVVHYQITEAQLTTLLRFAFP